MLTFTLNANYPIQLLRNEEANDCLRLSQVSKAIDEAKHFVTSTAVNGAPVSDDGKIGLPRALYLVIDSHIFTNHLDKLITIRKHPSESLIITLPFSVNKYLDRLKLTSAGKYKAIQAGRFISANISSHFTQQTPHHSHYINLDCHKRHESPIINLCCYYKDQGKITGILSDNEQTNRVARSFGIYVYTWEDVSREFGYTFQV